MIGHRLLRLRVQVCPVLTIFGVWLAGEIAAPALAQSQQTAQGQQNSQPPAPSTTPNQQQPSTQQKPPNQQQQPPKQQQNPFENVPEAPKPEAQPNKNNAGIIEDIEFRGQRRIPQDTLRALILSRKGDVYSDDAIHRDFMALWNSGRFDDLKVEKQTAPDGGIIIRFIVAERRVIRSIDYTGNKSISKSEILDRFKDRKVGLSPESQYDPGKVQRAKNVLQEFEAERGRQYATVTPEVRQVPPSSVEINFKIDEGPKVKVGKINLQGNNAFSDRVVIRSMKNLKPIGIPYSILFENLFARTYDSTKLDEDSERMRMFYQSKGYYEAHVVDHTVTIHDVGGHGFRIPILKPNHMGKNADITMTIDEGQKYYLRNFNFVGMKLFRTPDLIAKQVFGMGPGDVFSTQKLQKGIENIRKLYGDFGYIDFVPEPDPEPVPNSNKIDLTINVDEGHQFFVRRIDFQGNVTTRDKVIRRELLIDEGDLFSQRLWDTSILKLNQLGFFDQLKPEDATDIKRDTKTNTVDLLLKLKEKGKNSIQLNGGVSGIAGSFIGFQFATRNFLGLGETLSLDSQIGTRLDSVTLGFTEPYLFDKPYTAGFTVYLQRFNYNQAREASILSGENLISYYNSFGPNNLLNYVTNGRGFTTFVTHPIKRSFARIGLTYGFDIQNVSPLTPAATTYFQYLDFEGLAGPNSYSGIKTSKITPTYSYNSTNSPIAPTQGLRVSSSFGVSGSYLGGNVDTLQPLIDVAYFRHGFFKGNVLAFHFNARYIAGYDGRDAPPFSRFYMGGENDIRGFDLWSISPAAFIPTEQNTPVYNADGTQRVQQVISNGAVTTTPVTMNVPGYTTIFPGGDTSGVFNFEYRIPIFGPVTLAPFFDAGVNRVSQASQLQLNSGEVANLNALFPQSDFGTRALIDGATEAIRSSTGLEIQVIMPVVNAPFRVYFAYNPTLVRTNIQPPIVADRSYFPNDYTYNQYIQTYALSYPYDERTTTFRFTIGRTF
ncbi:MAG: outer membrane protein assembly factor BamA [Bryobacteraceae bacterium]